MIRVKITDNVSPKLRGIKLTNFIHKEWVKETSKRTQMLLQLIPKNSLKLAKAVYSRTYKKPLRAFIGIAPTFGPANFDYSQFVAGRTAIVIKKPNKFFKTGQTIVYGGPALSPSGQQIDWYADGNWWEYFEERAEQGYINATRRGRNAYVKAMNS
jgi:hypothetical protein